MACILLHTVEQMQKYIKKQAEKDDVARPQAIVEGEKFNRKQHLSKEQITRSRPSIFLPSNDLD